MPARRLHDLTGIALDFMWTLDFVVDKTNSMRFEDIRGESDLGCLESNAKCVFVVRVVGGEVVWCFGVENEIIALYSVAPGYHSIRIL